MTCDEILARWDDGDRSPDVAAHVASCPDCRALLAVDEKVRGWKTVPKTSEAAFMERLREKMKRPAAIRVAGPSAPAVWPRLAAAAVFIAALGAAFWLGRTTHPQVHRKETAANPTPAPRPAPVPKPIPTPLPTPGPAPQPAPPRPVEDADKKEFKGRLMAAAAGTGAGRDAFLSQIRSGTDRSRWISALRSPDAAERSAAVTIASVARDAAVAPDLAIAGARGDERAIAAIGDIGGPAAVPALASLAGVRGRREAVESALAATGLPEAAETLAALGAWSNEAAWRRLGNAAAPAIAARLRQNGEARVPAITAAGWAKAEGAVPELIKLLSRRDSREAAINSLASIGGPRAAAALAEIADEFDEELLKALKAVGPGREALEKRLLDVRLAPTDRARAARTLVALGDHAAEPALITALDSPEIRGDAALALGDLKCEAAVPGISKLLRERRFRDSAAEALAKIGSAKAIPALALASRDRSFREEALRAMTAIRSPEAVPYMIAALGDRDLAGAAIDSLGAIGDTRAVLPLIGMLDSERGGQALDALRKITGQKLPGKTDAWVRWWKANMKSGKSFDFSCF
ncbi:MAG: HEAT repeat domain-containing protein [Planctomycetes bacterium]|nr:HEAT repeat domain-containing protein [Planctomycetota bacterium]